MIDDEVKWEWDAKSLAKAIRKKAIEECAQVLERLGAYSYQGHDLPAAIRALKDRP